MTIMVGMEKLVGNFYKMMMKKRKIGENQIITYIGYIFNVIIISYNLHVRY